MSVPRRDARAARRARRDPRAECDRSRSPPPARSQPRRKSVTLAEPACWVLAVPDQPDGYLSEHDRDMLGAARRLADAGRGAVIALVFAADDSLGAAGADRVMCFDTECNATRAAAAGGGATECCDRTPEARGPAPEARGPAPEARGPAPETRDPAPETRDPAPEARGYAPEARTACVLAAIRALNPRHILLPDTPHGGGDLGRRVAAALGEMPATNVVSFEEERVGSLAGGGRRELLRSPPRVVLIAPEAAEPVTETLHEAVPLPAPAFERERARLVDLGPMPVDPAAVPLAEAELILSAGAGVEDWETFHALAAALGASEGGSRVVCDAGSLPRDRQIGASGTLVAARGYLALGISGAPQHLEGIAGCECVVAVNTDAHAEIVKRADLAVIGDVQQIMPELLRELRRRKRSLGD